MRISAFDYSILEINGSFVTLHDSNQTFSYIDFQYLMYPIPKQIEDFSR